jgi:hypothetical protein
LALVVAHGTRRYRSDFFGMCRSCLGAKQVEEPWMNRRGRLATASAMVGVLSLAGCGGGDDAGTAGRSTSVPSSVGAPPSTTAAGTGPFTSTTTGSPSSTAGPNPATTTPGGTNPTSTVPPAGQTPRTGPLEGVTLDYPPGWGPAGQLLATAFASGATCGSAAIVDRDLPPNAGPGAMVEQSFVQFCWRGLDGRTLADFMAATYGSVGGFQPTTLGGRPAFVSSAGTSATYFVDTPTRRYQVSTSVVASSALEATRLAEVQRILSTLSLST